MIHPTFCGFLTDASQLRDGGCGETEIQLLKGKVGRGKVDKFDDTKATLEVFARACFESKKFARRARIRRQWEAEGQDRVFNEFQLEEKAALITLKQANIFARLRELGDDE